MAPFAKDVETLTATNTPTVPSNASVATRNPQDATTRPQPVPLEVPVTVNGARTIEGTDKREPFSESTKTVLVFANGAVIRLASSVAPGQLLFVTNEKSKKEVVCQVVKSKNYRTVTGYVELEFTEPAAGFWGVRIPEAAMAPSVAPKAPTAPRPAAPPAIPSAVTPAAAPKTPTATPIAPPVPVATKPNVPAVAPNKPAVMPPPPAPAISAKPVAKLPTVAEFLAASPVAPPQPPVAKVETLPAQLATQLSALVNPSADAPSVVKVQPPVPPAASPAAESTDATTDELRQQAARLQEQLSSLLFRAEAAEKKNELASVATPAEPTKESKPVPKAAETPVPAISKPEITPSPITREAKSIPVPNSVAETKPASSAAKSTQFNLKVEEVKIPSWLAPLARDTESATQSTAAQDASDSASVETDNLMAPAGDASVATEERAATSRTVVFGGQLLGSANAETAQATSSGSKTGLILGLAAAAALVIGGVWYGLQPGNFLAGKSAAPQSYVSNNPPAAISAPNSVTSTAASTTNSAPINSVPAAAVGSHPAGTPPANAATVDPSKALNIQATPETKSGNLAARTAPAVEQPKKPALGDVRLAKPNVNRSEGAASNEAAPTIDSADATSSGDPLVGLAAGNRPQPTAPLPVGGDVKPAQLLKSVPPVYPTNAKTQRVAGDVKLDALIDAEGNVSTTKVLSGPVLLHQAAAAALKQWKYQPALLDGKPTAMHLTVTVQFRLQ